MTFIASTGLERTIVLVRHGQATWNVEGRVPGQGNPTLTPLGVQQAGHAARQLLGGDYARVIASDLERARLSGQVIAESLGIPLELDVDLREQDAGELTGRRRSELQAEETPTGVHLHEVRWGGGESVVDVYDRLERFFARLEHREPGNVILVSHGHTIQVALALLTGLGPRDVEWREIPNGGVIWVVPEASVRG